MKNNAKLLDWSIYIVIIFIPISFILYLLQDYWLLNYFYPLSMSILAGGIVALITNFLTYKRNETTKRDDIYFLLHDIMKKLYNIEFLCDKDEIDKNKIENWCKIIYSDWNDIPEQEQKTIINNKVEHYKNKRIEKILETLMSYNEILNFDLNNFLRIIEDISFPFYKKNKLNIIQNKLMELFNNISKIQNYKSQLNLNFEQNSMNISIKVQCIKKLENNIFKSLEFSNKNFDRKKVKTNFTIYGEYSSAISDKHFVYQNILCDEIKECIEIIKNNFV